MRILLIGSDQEISGMMTRILRRKGYYVLYAKDLADSKKLLKNQDIALVISDMEMNDNEKKDFCQKIRLYDKNVRLLLISGNVDDEVSSLYAGADEWMKKPYRMEVLLARISVLLRMEARKQNEMKRK